MPRARPKRKSPATLSIPEHWRPLIFNDGRPLDGYEVSDRARVRSYWVRRGRNPYLGFKPVIRVPNSFRRGGRTITLRTARAEFNAYPLARLVAYSFLGMPPEPSFQVIHLNHKPDDNRAENLAWVDRSNASMHAIEKRPRRPLAKLTPAQVRTIRESPELGSVLAARYGVYRRAIYDIRKYRTWRDVL